MPSIQTTQALPARQMRRPVHNYGQYSKPWEINIAAIAPVVPGETLKNALIQERCISAPLASPIMGWWNEHYLFYVTHRQIQNYNSDAEITSMVFDNTVTLNASAADVPTYYAGHGYNWAAGCRDVIVKEWFREEGETVATATGRESRPLAKIGMEGIGDSLVLNSAVPGGTGGSVPGSVQDLDQAQEAYEYMRTMGFTKLSYEAWIAAYGVSLPRVAARDRPELLRRSSDWTYPVNVVNASTGVPSSAVSFGSTVRADKDRFFVEPGFIVLIRVQRPKAYRELQAAFGSAVLDRVQRWLPPQLAHDPSASLAELAATEGPFGRAANGAAHWLDVRDLFVHGDQWIDTGTANRTFLNGLPLPANTTLQNRYPTETMGNALFVSSATISDCILRADGALSLHILGRQEDYT